MMSYTFSELLEWADNVSGIYSPVTHTESSVRVWGKGRKCVQCSLSAPRVELAAPEPASPFGAELDLWLHPASTVLCSG